MQTNSTTTVHPLDPADAAAMVALREMTKPMKGLLRGVEARPAFDDIMGHVPAPEGVTFEADTVGGVSGWWCRPSSPVVGAAILYLHGGWYVWGTAAAYRNFVGHVAARSGIATFIADYRLAPEHPFPAGLHDARGAYRGLIDLGLSRVAVVGDSAGGGLTLSLLSLLKDSSDVSPVGAVAFSPLTDMTLSGETWETKAEADPFFTRSQGVELAPLYLAGHDPKDPLVSPLFADLTGLPPIRIHVGEDELLLSDSTRLNGSNVQLDIWEGMPHVFLSSVGQLAAAGHALDAVAAFLKAQI